MTTAPCRAAPPAAEAPLILRHFRMKLAYGLGVLAYYLVGYFVLNRLPFRSYHDVPQVPLLDDLPIIPWTILVYNSVFILCALGILLLGDPAAIRRYFVSLLFAYTINYILFALIPTRIDRAPIPEEGSMWLWALRLTRVIDAPHTCFPSLHITNCALLVIALWRTRFGPWFLAWTLAIAWSTLTTDQHLFLDLPAGGLMALMGFGLMRIVERRRKAEIA